MFATTNLHLTTNRLPTRPLYRRSWNLMQSLQRAVSTDDYMKQMSQVGSLAALVDHWQLEGVKLAGLSLLLSYTISYPTLCSHLPFSLSVPSALMHGCPPRG